MQILASDDECSACEHADSCVCSLYALQHRMAKSCDATCIRSCFDGEDSKFRDGRSEHECVEQCGSGCLTLALQFPTFNDRADGQSLAGPARDWPSWVLQLGAWKFMKLSDSKVDGGIAPESKASIYSSSDRVKRSSATYVTVQTMVHDRNLYDPVEHRWTAKKYLDDLKHRFGGIDQILLWPGYPNIGVDSRSQFDMIEALPGGPKAAVRALREADPDLMIQWPYKPWDISTNGLGANDPEKLARLVVDSGADGINADTMNSKEDIKNDFYPMEVFFDAAKKAGMPDMIIEPELGMYPGLPYLNVTTQGWQYNLQRCYSCKKVAPFVPPVSSQKLLARRAMPHVCGRWATQRSEEILTAFFNGVGYVAWENIWGIWNGFHDRDGELLRRSVSLLRHFHELISDPAVAWLPHYPLENFTTDAGHVFASKYVGKDAELWLLINSGTTDAQPSDWILPVPSHDSQSHEYYDIHHGKQLKPEASPSCLVKSCQDSKDGATHSTLVRLQVEARGVGAVLRVAAGQLPPGDAEFMESMAKLTSRPLKSYAAEWGPVTTQKLVLRQSESKGSLDTSGMIRIAGSSAFEFRSTGVEIEGFLNDNGVMDDWRGVDVQYPWETFPTKYHDAHSLSVGNLWVDKHPATNANFLKFLCSAQYSPKDASSLLRHWGGTGCKGCNDCHMPPDIVNQPVVFVSLEDAQSYCQYSGKRLPREWEWQYIAQGGDPERRYPWGMDWQQELMPEPQSDARYAKMSDVGGYPKGASKDGVEDLVGLIWHWTDEYEDLHTRAAVLKGGSAFQPQRWQEPRYQPWYFPGLAGDWKNGAPWKPPYSTSAKNYSLMYNLTSHGKYLLMAPSLDRAGTIGFRCVADIGEQ